MSQSAVGQIENLIVELTPEEHWKERELNL